jgi:hypothetical protein
MHTQSSWVLLSYLDDRKIPKEIDHNIQYLLLLESTTTCFLCLYRHYMVYTLQSSWRNTNIIISIPRTGLTSISAIPPPPPAHRTLAEGIPESIYLLTSAARFHKSNRKYNVLAWSSQTSWPRPYYSNITGPPNDRPRKVQVACSKQSFLLQSTPLC